MAKKKKEDLLEKYTVELEREFRQWDVYYNYGGSDPFHEDGVNLNLIRNHIIYYKQKIEEEINKSTEQLSFNEKKFPDIYFKETPPKVDYTYMAVPNKILDTGISFVEKLEANPSYQFILKHIDTVFPEEKETEISKALGISFIPTMQLRNYSTLVRSGDLVAIRRTFYRTDFDKFINKLEETAQKFEQFLALAPEEKEKMSVKRKRKNNYDHEDTLHDDEEIDIEDKPSINSLIEDAQKRTKETSDEERNSKTDLQIR